MIKKVWDSGEWALSKSLTSSLSADSLPGSPPLDVLVPKLQPDQDKPTPKGLSCLKENTTVLISHHEADCSDY